MLDASRIVLGKLHVEREPLFVREVVADAVAVIKPDADAKKMSTDVRGLDETVVVRGDRERLKQVVWNLLSNAVKFTPDGGNIRVRVVRDDREAIVEVADDGEGIDRDLLGHVFDRFTQGSGSVRKGGDSWRDGLSARRFPPRMFPIACSGDPSSLDEERAKTPFAAQFAVRVEAFRPQSRVRRPLRDITRADRAWRPFWSAPRNRRRGASSMHESPR